MLEGVDSLRHVAPTEHELARHQAVEKTIALSLERLSDSEQRRFMELAVFPEDVDVPLQTLEKLWGRTGGLDDLDTENLSERLRTRPWIRILDAGQSLNLRRALTILRGEGIAVISALGGRRVASSLLAAGLVTDLYLTSVGESGQAHPRDFHDGPPVLHQRVLAKTSHRGTRHVRFEHLVTPAGHAFAKLRVGN